MASKGSCKSTIMLAHADKGPIPVGPAGSSKEDVEHQCMGAADGMHPAHYCGCGVEWNDRNEIIDAPWDKAPWQVFRNGKPLSEPLPDQNAAWTWILKHQGMSVDWAMKYEGYSIGKVPVPE